MDKANDLEITGSRCSVANGGLWIIGVELSGRHWREVGYLRMDARSS